MPPVATAEVEPCQWQQDGLFLGWLLLVRLTLGWRRGEMGGLQTLWRASVFFMVLAVALFLCNSAAKTG